jgi:hypothetical protein
MRRIIATLAATAAVLAGALAVAPAAQARDVTIDGCQPGMAFGPFELTLFFLSSGNSVTALTPAGVFGGSEEADGCYVADADSQGAASVEFAPDFTSGTMRVFGANGQALVLTALLEAGDLQRIGYIVGLSCDDFAEVQDEIEGEGYTYVALCDPDGVPIAPVYQQTTPIADGSCDITDPSYDLAGVESGGWTSSWAEWPNGGTGGSVCARTLVYSDALGHWTVEAPAAS